MLKRALVLAAITLSVLSPEAAGGTVAPPAQVMYVDAMAMEKAVRTALAPDEPPVTVLKAVRTAVEQYESIVRAYPTSGYCDDALWNAAQLSLAAFDKLGFAQDKSTGVRLLRTLASEYPTSRFAKQVPQQLARAAAAAIGRAEPLTRAEPAAPVLTRSATPAPSPMPTASQAPTPVTTAPPPAVSAPAPRSADGTEAARVPRATATGIAMITDIRRAILPDVVRVTIELDGEVKFREERLDGPARVFVDLALTQAAPALLDQTIRFEDDAELVRQIRLGRHPNNTTRVVLEAAGVSSFSVYPLYSPYRLIIDCVRPAETVEPARHAGPLAPVTGPAGGPLSTTRGGTPAPSPLKSRAIVLGSVRVGPEPAPEGASDLAAARLDAPPAIGTNAVAPPPSAAVTAPDPSTPASVSPPTAEALPNLPARNIAGGLSIARQLGLSVARIVIDPGHGGHDPGARAGGMTEAELVLDVALRLERLLAKVPGVEVVLTRRTDEFVPLQERTAIANRERADLFLSIHANASTNLEARGVETYFLDLAKTFSEKAVAARENAENAASGRSMGDFPEFLKAIALDNKVDESRELATIVQRALVNTLKSTNKTVRDLGVRQAPFVVLIGAAMPSVLSEISFITNGPEARLLRGSAYRQRIAEGLFNAIRKYQTSLKSTRTAAAERP